MFGSILAPVNSYILYEHLIKQSCLGVGLPACVAALRLGRPFAWGRKPLAAASFLQAFSHSPWRFTPPLYITDIMGGVNLVEHTLHLKYHMLMWCEWYRYTHLTAEDIFSAGQ